MAAAGLFLKKRTGAIFAYVAIAAVVNIALNYLLIPRFGVSGSAIATLLSFAVLLVIAMLIGRSELTIPFPLLALVVSVFAFGASCVLAAHVTSGSPWLDLFLHTAVVLVVYPVIALGLDPRLRRSAREMAQIALGRWRQWRGG
ncbi:MAG: polysaccharide biosynthesis C-terminal domain-containing protein [Rudaea sp.]|uniref:polysaccharide biosynthesis C-terminal domain-containing protein n=1 Tax=Rudaea sp. TaxID=2136325 RepID=UPI0039E50295